VSEFSVPSDEAFFQESCRFLNTCTQECTCANAWHYIWSGFKASGRRRSIYYQQPLLKNMMTPLIPSIRSVLIAGAADAGILSVLASILEADVRYVAIDICNAPVKEMQLYAQEHGLKLECQKIPLQDFVPQETFDLIFISNTFVFMQPGVVMQTLAQLQRGMHADSWMICGMRYQQKDEASSRATAEASAVEFRSMIAQTYARRPDLIALLEPLVNPYFHNAALSQRYPYQPDEFASMLSESGYSRVDSFRDDITPVKILNSVSQGFFTLSDVHLLQLM
jgi:hypothetical protein